VADYPALRAYAGGATSVFVRASGIAGTFTRDDADTASADNGGTVIVAANGKRWKRTTSDPLDIRWFGGVADYGGTPVYDGADAGRITATDNTLAFQRLVNAAITAGKDAVRLPAGHWGIKTGNLSFSNFGKLRIFGDGTGVTILDFIKEDTSFTGGAVVSPAQANAIASFTTGTELEFQDLTVKATTKGGVVNGVAGSNRVYEGAVWGFKINNVATVRFTRVRAERFNYRGFSVVGIATERVVMQHCEGFYNASSGFWVENAAIFRVQGGEFAYNGVFGETGTGYGVTASASVGKFIVEAAYCHHNYRKGIDSHGCAEFIVKHCTFQDNVLYHLANVTTAAPAVTDRSVIIKGNTFSNGRLAVDKAWLKTCYDQLATNGYANDIAAPGRVFHVQDYLTASDNIRSVYVEDNTVLCHYNGIGDTALTQNPYFMEVLAAVGKIVFRGNRIDFQYCQMTSVGNVNNHVAIRLRGDTTVVADNDIKFMQATAYTNVTSGAADRGTLFEFKASDLRLDMINNRFELNDCYFMTSTGAGLRAAISWATPGSRRNVRDNTWIYADDPFNGSFTGIDDNFFLGNSATVYVPLQHSGNSFIRNGVAYEFPNNGPLNRTCNTISYRLNGVAKALGADVFYIILDKQYNTTIRITTNDGTPDLVIQIPFSTYTGITGTSTNGQFEFSSADAAFVENGLTKLKITLKAKAALSGYFCGRVMVDGPNTSFGAEKAVQL
jgi:hypothetical protein